MGAICEYILNTVRSARDQSFEWLRNEAKELKNRMHILDPYHHILGATDSRQVLEHGNEVDYAHGVLCRFMKCGALPLCCLPLNPEFLGDRDAQPIFQLDKILIGKEQHSTCNLSFP